MADILVIPYPDTRYRYRARSPIQFVDHASYPAIILQGLEDWICAASHAESMVAALRAKSVPVAYVPFAGEQHGNPRAENIRCALDAELSFYLWSHLWFPACRPRRAGHRREPIMPDCRCVEPVKRMHEELPVLVDGSWHAEPD